MTIPEDIHTIPATYRSGKPHGTWVAEVKAASLLPTYQAAGNVGKFTLEPTEQPAPSVPVRG